MSFENFPYSNFHDMNLDWVINQWLEMKKSFATYEQAFKDLKEFVDSYFANLDVQEEINKKLDVMVSDGSLLNIIKPTITSTTSEWLQNNISTTSTPIDKSLEVENAGADSYTVGNLGLLSSQQNILEPTFDVNTCEPNRIYLISGDCRNLPSGEKSGGMLFSIARYHTSPDTYAQFFVSVINNLYIRFKEYGGTWTDWTPYNIENTNFASTGVNILETTFDVNTCEPNRIYLISVDCKNLPSGEKSGGMLFSIARYHTSTDTYAQFFVSVYNNLYIRFKEYGGSWTDWKSCVEDEFFNLAIFEKMGVVGDSYSSGAIYKNNVEFTAYYNYSWIQLMSKKIGNTAFNFSSPGESTRTWLTSDQGLSKLQSSDICSLIYLCLGINDYYSLGESYLGTIADIDSKADTFYGNYAKIIDSIKAKSDKTRMLMCTLAYTTDYNQNVLIEKFNTAIINIASHYNIPVARLDNNFYFNSDFYKNNMIGGHPTLTGYSGMAIAYEKLTNEAIKNNYLYYNNLV